MLTRRLYVRAVGSSVGELTALKVCHCSTRKAKQQTLKNAGLSYKDC